MGKSLPHELDNGDDYGDNHDNRHNDDHDDFHKAQLAAQAQHVARSCP